MFSSLRDTFEVLRDQVWFFRFFLLICIICVYRTLLHFVLRTNHCPNPFCSKCLGSGSVRGRAINRIKKDYDDDENNSLKSIVLNNLVQHDRLVRRNDEKPTVYYHRGLSSNQGKISDEEILLKHYDELRQEIIKFLQNNDNIQWTDFYLYKNGEENQTNCKSLPKLFEILHLLPNAICINNENCIFGNCFLTRLISDKNENEKNQNGLTNCCIRMNFGLICDEQSPAHVLINKHKRLPIENKRATLYNDGLEHSIQNPTNKQQIFLTIDFWHPDLSLDMRKELTTIFHTNLA
ncbi:unnamed protein product [Adineta steineri]|uniref:Aspartyl/asparaginy/proline hydroxylase domain-containing protein n=1 Tax=Adineta steineri TaxID=433720 RepID=A0A818S0A3_9BILA|nr:unnamed protein product [Adineta steineri]CAF0826513.1 unnamed protein product [Adineta steineri]CAF3483704.1 unnamed protein product [Adineta steineri]CAF3665758.1 unnamed protein product [Adineta steineri]CAF3919985.1 unnamed protein product [Adineta steineri]